MSDDRSKEFVGFLYYSMGMEVRSYSGRYMYGKSCVYFVSGLTTGALIGSIMNSLEDWNFEGMSSREIYHYISDAFNHMLTDSMGLDTVYYFPHIEWKEEWYGLTKQLSLYLDHYALFVLQL